MNLRLDNVPILVVDDDEDIRAGIALALRVEGANILQAADGNEAVVMWRAHEPRVVVLDMMLPKRSGFLGARRTRRVILAANCGHGYRK